MAAIQLLSAVPLLKYWLMPLSWRIVTSHASLIPLMIPSARASFEKVGGRQLVGGEFETMEGAWAGTRIVVHEFPDMETAKAWYNSDDFQPLVKIRQRVSTGNLLIADGF